MSYAPPPGPHGGIPHQQQWGAAQPPPPLPYRGPARPRKLLVILVGLMVTAASVSAIALSVLWWDNTAKETGFTDTTLVKNDGLPGPRGMSIPVPPPAGGGS